MAKYRNSDGVPNEGVPPFMVINWADWESDPHVEKMSETGVGIFFRLLLKQWKNDPLPAAPWTLADSTRSRYENVKNFLHSYGHLFRCHVCGGIAWSEKWDHDPGEHRVVDVEETCSKPVVPVYCPCSCLVAFEYCMCSEGVAFMYQPKHRNYRKDVTYRQRLGTTEYNIIKENGIEYPDDAKDDDVPPIPPGEGPERVKSGGEIE